MLCQAHYTTKCLIVTDAACICVPTSHDSAEHHVVGCALSAMQGFLQFCFLTTCFSLQTPYFWPSNCWEPENTDYGERAVLSQPDSYFVQCAVCVLKRLMMQTVCVVHKIYLSSRYVITADATKSSKDETQVMQLQYVDDRQKHKTLFCFRRLAHSWNQLQCSWHAITLSVLYISITNALQPQWMPSA